jgi:hypothetical protein
MTGCMIQGKGQRKPSYPRGNPHGDRTHRLVGLPTAQQIVDLTGIGGDGTEFVDAVPYLFISSHLP